LLSKLRISVSQETEDGIFITLMDEELKRKTSTTKQDEFYNRLSKPLQRKSGRRKKQHTAQEINDGKMPGPGSYEVNGTLIRSTFNRKQNRTKTIKKAKSIENFENPPFRDEDLHNDMKIAGAFLNYKKAIRSKSAPSLSTTLWSMSPKNKSSKIYDVNKTNPMLTHKRYPPQSEKIMKRWSTVTNNSFKWNVPGRKMKIVIS